MDSVLKLKIHKGWRKAGHTCRNRITVSPKSYHFLGLVCCHPTILKNKTTIGSVGNPIFLLYPQDLQPRISFLPDIGNLQRIINSNVPLSKPSDFHRLPAIWSVELR